MNYFSLCEWWMEIIFNIWKIFSICCYTRVTEIICLYVDIYVNSNISKEHRLKSWLQISVIKTYFSLSLSKPQLFTFLKNTDLFCCSVHFTKGIMVWCEWNVFTLTFKMNSHAFGIWWMKVKWGLLYINLLLPWRPNKLLYGVRVAEWFMIYKTKILWREWEEEFW